jgi:hypothetical protein
MFKVVSSTFSMFKVSAMAENENIVNKVKAIINDFKYFMGFNFCVYECQYLYNGKV